MDPLNPTKEPTEMVDGDTASDIDVEVMKFAVSVMGSFIVKLPELLEPEKHPVPVQVQLTKAKPVFGVA